MSAQCSRPIASATQCRQGADYKPAAFPRSSTRPEVHVRSGDVIAASNLRRILFNFDQHYFPSFARSKPSLRPLPCCGTNNSGFGARRTITNTWEHFKHRGIKWRHSFFSRTFNKNQVTRPKSKNPLVVQKHYRATENSMADHWRVTTALRCLPMAHVSHTR